MSTLLEMACFCNLTVHCTRIDDARGYGLLKKQWGDMDAFAETVQAYL